MTGFELPPRTVDDRDRRLIALEAAEELRELELLQADRNAEKWPAPTWEMHCG